MDCETDLRVRMTWVKCERFKILEAEPLNKKFFDIDVGSMHRLKLLSDENDFDKATQVDFPQQVEEELLKEEGEETEEDEEEEEEEEEAEKEKEEVEEIEVAVVEQVPKKVKKKVAKVVQKPKGKGMIGEGEEGEDEESRRRRAGRMRVVEEEEEIKPEEEEDIEVEEEEIIAIKAATGLFRDETRRVDMVLVLHDDVKSKTDRLKLDFVTNILRAGLEIEIEPGLMPIHKHLCFIKLHLPDHVLIEYGKVFAVRRFFVENRLRLMGASNKNIFDWLRSFYRFRYYKNHEKEWLKIVRNNYTPPNGYSNYERSIITYKILRHLPYGDYVNQYGIHRLLKKNIILSVYQLHDGPYFYVPKQNILGSNARQILFYNWAGLHNLFQSQPIHLIHEYYGPKIAFYFTFYAFYNKALIFPAVAGVVTMLMRFADVNKEEVDELIRLTCKVKRSRYICPECDSNVTLHYGRILTRCYPREISDYCLSMKMNAFVDHRTVKYYSICIMLWGMVFVLLWRKKEYVLNWMWEVGGFDSYYKISTRPEFVIDYLNPRRSTRTALKYDENGWYKFIRITVPIIHVLFMCYLSLVIMDELKIKYDNFSNSFETKEKKSKYRDYIIMGLFQTLYTFLITGIERIAHYFYYFVVDLENHKSLEAHERSLVKKQLELSSTLMYSFLTYYGWTMGRQQQYRGRCQWNSFLPLRKFIIFINDYIRTPWRSTVNTSGPDCKRFCWPFTCILELAVLLVTMLILKEVIFRIIFNVYRIVTDYNEARKINKWIPCWEREYKLNEFSEADLNRKYFNLAIQFTLVTYFVISFPLAPLIVLIVNVWDMRHTASTLVQASRRPLLIRSPGIGAWSNAYLYMAYAAIVSNVLTLVFTIRYSVREFMESRGMPINQTLQLVLYDLNASFDFADISYMECGMPFLRRHMKESPIDYPNYFLIGSNPKVNHTLSLEYYHFIEVEVIFLIKYFIYMLGIAVIIHFLVLPRTRKDVEKTIAKEKKIKNLYAYYNFVENSK